MGCVWDHTEQQPSSPAALWFVARKSFLGKIIEVFFLGKIIEVSSLGKIIKVFSFYDLNFIAINHRMFDDF